MDFKSNRRTRTGPAVPPRIRVQVLRRDNNSCCLRLPGCIGEATEVDHIIPVFEGGDDHPDNLQAVCPPCHKQKTQDEAQRARAKLGRKREPMAHPSVGLMAPWGSPPRPAELYGGHRA